MEEIVGRRAFDEDFSHVAHIEQADRLADGHVFLDDARVLEGHLPAAELNEACAGRSMPIKQGRARCHPNRQRADE